MEIHSLSFLAGIKNQEHRIRNYADPSTNKEQTGHILEAINHNPVLTIHSFIHSFFHSFTYSLGTKSLQSPWLKLFIGNNDAACEGKEDSLFLMLFNFYFFSKTKLVSFINLNRLWNSGELDLCAWGKEVMKREYLVLLQTLYFYVFHIISVFS